MGTLKDLVEEAKRRTILWAILVFCLAYFMSLTSSSIWINIPVAILLLAVVHRLSLEVEIRRKPPDGPPPPRHQLRRQLNPNDPLLSAPSNFTRSRWRHNIDSPSVEVAVDELTKCLIDEWVTNLWYSSLTPDQEFPEELRLLINNVIGELARRVKRVDLMALICRDMVDLVGSHLELFRQIKTKVGVDVMASLSVEERDEKLKEAMLVSRELHPALISHESEYKVLKRLVGGVVALVLRREDLRCRLLRSIARELLTCAVLQPVLNFASPGFINELIESFTLTSKEKSGQANQAQSTSGYSNAKDVRSRLPERILQRKPSLSGLEMMAISNLEGSIGQESKIIQPSPKNKGVHSASTGDLRAFVTQLQISDAKSLKEVANISEHPGSECHGELGSVPQSDWAQVLDAVSLRRTQALTPEHLDNLWAKGRNYKKREIAKTTSLGATVSQAADYPGKSINLVLSESRVIAKSMAGTEGTPMTTNLAQLPVSLDRLHKNADSVDFLGIKQGHKSTERYKGLLFDNSEDRGQQFPGIGFSLHDTDEEHQHPLSFSEDLQVPNDSSSSQLATMESTQNQHGTAGIAQNSLSFSKNLERLDSDQQQYERRNILSSHRKSRSDDGGLEKWQELQGGSHQVEAVPTSLNSGRPTATTVLPHPDNVMNRSHIEDESEMSSRPMTDVPTTVLTSHMSLNKLYCKVMGAHFEKAGSKTFAVYTIRVRDSDNRTWQVHRRFRNFEQLHRRLKDMPNYALSLPRKRFFTSSLDNDFVLERCVLLDKYLRDLLAIPSIAELHEVWDFLSINSQHYAFGVAPSMMKTLAVNVDDAMDDMFRQIRGVSDDIQGVLKTATSGIRYRFPLGSADISQTGMTSAFLQSAMSTTPRSSLNPKLSGPTQVLSLSDSGYGEKIFASSLSEDEDRMAQEYSGAQGFGSADWQSDSDLQTETHEALTHQFGSTSLDDRENLYFGRRPERALSEGHSPADSFMSELVEDELVIPQEWSPPKVSVPLLNLVDVIFQLQGRGWIRRQVLWMAKQILQVGLGDAIDDWLLEKIQWLRSDDTMATGIQWVRGILWPDGIFVTKHPSRSGLSSTNSGAPKGSGIKGAMKGGQRVQQQAPVNSFEYRLEALRRAMIVREILLDRAPAALVNLIGKKQYTRCATDIYNFSQSTVCVKQLAYSLLEMLLLATFPELHNLLLDVRSGVS